LQKARDLAPQASEKEQDYIAALTKRYSADEKADRQKLAHDYKTAMGELVKKYPDDLDAATLFAESMMNLRPWQLWSLEGKPAEGTLEIVAVLESVLNRNPNHTGANHYYIHAVEASPNPERALPSALRLGRLAPKAGHLVHMPSHIFIRTGDYTEAAESNRDAIRVDREYINRAGNQNLYAMMYFNHNIHFLASATAMKGRYADAINAARELYTNVQPHIAAMPMLEMFTAYKTVTLVRFGQWDELLKDEKPAEEMKITTIFRHFGRGMALAAGGKTGEAEAELKTYQTLAGQVPADAPYGNSSAAQVLKVGEQVLLGKIAFAKGERPKAVEFFKKAVEAEDLVNYNEPPDWDLPAREFLGGALLLAGENAAAEAVFRAELKKHPRNGRALFGLAESLKKQGNSGDAEKARQEFDKSWADADTKLRPEDLLGLAHTNLPRYGDISLETGVRLRYAEQGDENGLPVILLHGYGDSSVSYSRVMPLMDAKYRVFALDQRGHGESDRPESGYKFADFAADVLAFMDAKKIKKAIIVGHSMGSFVAQHIAVNAPERVEKLVLIGSAATVRNDLVGELKKAVDELKDPVPVEFIREFQYGTVYQKPPEDFMNRIIGESQKLPARVWREVMSGMIAADSKSQLGKIKAPTLILWGDREPTFKRAEQDELRTGIPHALFKVYPGIGHCPNWERPEEVVRDLEAFINQ
jgi:pimeloyl-ACP methyl ester carboxylesterase/tetratricopeptide (TPR) repeat protein